MSLRGIKTRLYLLAIRLENTYLIYFSIVIINIIYFSIVIIVLNLENM